MLQSRILSLSGCRHPTLTSNRRAYLRETINWKWKKANQQELKNLTKKSLQQPSRCFHPLIYAETCAQAMNGHADNSRFHYDSMIISLFPYSRLLFYSATTREIVKMLDILGSSPHQRFCLSRIAGKDFIFILLSLDWLVDQLIFLCRLRRCRAIEPELKSCKARITRWWKWNWWHGKWMRESNSARCGLNSIVEVQNSYAMRLRSWKLSKKLSDSPLLYVHNTAPSTETNSSMSMRNFSHLYLGNFMFFRSRVRCRQWHSILSTHVPFVHYEFLCFAVQISSLFTRCEISHSLHSMTSRQRKKRAVDGLLRTIFIL